MNAAPVDKKQIRHAMRALRREIGPTVRASANIEICRSISRAGIYRRARHVAVYFSFDGEPDLTGLILSASATGKRFYAPIIDTERMSFGEFREPDELIRNDFGILEPLRGKRIDPRQLDLVLTPLVCCDERGTRMGVGRGYYDRCFHFLGERRQWRRPKLLGVAYERQQIPLLPREPWDIPLWGIVSESGLSRFN